jgi:hypothetical protein
MAKEFKIKGFRFSYGNPATNTGPTVETISVEEDVPSVPLTQKLKGIFRVMKESTDGRVHSVEEGFEKEMRWVKNGIVAVSKATAKLVVDGSKWMWIGYYEPEIRRATLRDEQTRLGELMEKYCDELNRHEIELAALNQVSPKTDDQQARANFLSKLIRSLPFEIDGCSDRLTEIAVDLDELDRVEGLVRRHNTTGHPIPPRS